MSEELPREEGLPSEEGLPERRICAVVQGCDQHSCEMLCFYLFGFSIIMFVSAFVASGCVLFLDAETGRGVPRVLARTNNYVETWSSTRTRRGTSRSISRG